MRKIALLTSERVTCQVNDGGYVYVCVSILQLYAWDGCGTATGYAKHMHRYHSNGKSRHYYWLSVSYFYYLHSLPSAEEDYELIGPPEYAWLNTCISPYQCAPFSCTHITEEVRKFWTATFSCYLLRATLLVVGGRAEDFGSSMSWQVNACPDCNTLSTSLKSTEKMNWSVFFLYYINYFLHVFSHTRYFIIDLHI